MSELRKVRGAIGRRHDLSYTTTPPKEGECMVAMRESHQFLSAGRFARCLGNKRLELERSAQTKETFNWENHAVLREPS